MAIRALSPAHEIATFRRSIGQEVSIHEVEQTLDNLNVEDTDEVMRAVKRCNNRCKDNKLRVEVSDQRAPERQLTFSVRLMD